MILNDDYFSIKHSQIVPLIEALCKVWTYNSVRFSSSSSALCFTKGKAIRAHSETRHRSDHLFCVFVFHFEFWAYNSTPSWGSCVSSFFAKWFLYLSLHFWISSTALVSRNCFLITWLCKRSFLRHPLMVRGNSVIELAAFMCRPPSASGFPIPMLFFVYFQLNIQLYDCLHNIFW